MEKEVVAITLENGEQIEIKKSLAEKWAKKSPEGYVFNYSGKIALMQLQPMNAKLNPENRLYSFSDCVAYMVKLHNIVEKDTVVFMKSLVNAEKSKYQPEKAEVKKATSKADAQNIADLKNFCNKYKIETLEEFRYSLKIREISAENSKAFIKLYMEHIAKVPEYKESEFNLPKLD